MDHGTGKNDHKPRDFQVKRLQMGTEHHHASPHSHGHSNPSVVVSAQFHQRAGQVARTKRDASTNQPQHEARENPSGHVPPRNGYAGSCSIKSTPAVNPAKDSMTFKATPMVRGVSEAFLEGPGFLDATKPI